MKNLLVMALLALPMVTLADTVVPVDAVESYVNIRSAPEAGAEVVGRLQQGDALPFVAAADGWNEVSLADGSSGFISADWTQVIVDDVASAGEVVEEVEPVVDTVAEDAAANDIAEATVAAEVAETPVAEVAPKPEPVTEPEPETEPEPAIEAAVDVESAPVAEAEPEPATEPEPENESEPAIEVAVDVEPATAAIGPAGPPGPQGPPGPPGPAGSGGIKGKPSFLVRFKEETEGESSQVFDNGNQVGIGTTEPKQRLEVNGSLQIHDRNSAVAGLMITQVDGDTGYVMHNRANTLTIGAGSEDRITIDRNGNVGMGETRPVHPLHMASGAHVTAGGVWVNSSSRTEKDNIASLTVEDALAVLEKLEPVHFSYRADGSEMHLGFIAEDVPDLVATSDRTGLASMDIVAVLTRVIQAQQAQIDALEARLDAQQ